jgi:hypothetical protein
MMSELSPKVKVTPADVDLNAGKPSYKNVKDQIRHNTELPLAVPAEVRLASTAALSAHKLRLPLLGKGRDPLFHILGKIQKVIEV